MSPLTCSQQALRLGQPRGRSALGKHGAPSPETRSERGDRAAKNRGRKMSKTSKKGKMQQTNSVTAVAEQKENEWMSEESMAPAGVQPDICKQVLRAFIDFLLGKEAETSLEVAVWDVIRGDMDIEDFLLRICALFEFPRVCGWVPDELPGSGYTATSKTRKWVRVVESQVGRIAEEPSRATEIAFGLQPKGTVPVGATTGLVVLLQKRLVWCNGVWFNRSASAKLEPRDFSILAALTTRPDELDKRDLITLIQQTEGHEKPISDGALDTAVNSLNRKMPKPFVVKQVCGIYRILEPKEFVAIEFHR